MISILDYGLGNIKAFLNVYDRLNIKAKVITKPDELLNATHIILPGVGAFDYAMTKLEESGFCNHLNEMVLEKKVPVLGVCVGMQMMADSSDEGTKKGLGWVSGEVKKIATTNEGALPLPHLGWNELSNTNQSPLFKNLGKSPRFYFLHSFYYKAKSADNILAEVDYGDRFTCVVNKDNIFGVQFHPEKSHENGLHILKNFASI